MPAVIMSGKALAVRIEQLAGEHLASLKNSHRISPRLGVVVVGSEEASQKYVKRKRDRCGRLGIEFNQISLPSTAAADSILSAVKELSSDDSCHGILVQLPLPPQITEMETREIFEAIDPRKDVDGVSSKTTIYFYDALPNFIFLPCTPHGILNMLHFYGIPVQGARVAVLGRNTITGKPMQILIGGRYGNATPLWVHRKSYSEHWKHDLAEYLRDADIIISFVGVRPPGRDYLITADMVKESSVIIDAGLRYEGHSVFGDVDFENVKEKAAYLTPPIGGVGPLTVASLIRNMDFAAHYAVHRDLPLSELYRVRPSYGDLDIAPA